MSPVANSMVEQDEDIHHLDKNKDENDDADETGAVEKQNPYLLLREAKIARNKARLLELGLLSDRQHEPLESRASGPLSSNPRRSSRRKRMEDTENDAIDDKVTTTLHPSVSLRRSSRRRRVVPSNPPSHPTTPSEPSHDNPFNLASSTSQQLQPPKEIHSQTTPNLKPAPPPPPAAPNSTRSTRIDISTILFGEPSPCLGRYLEERGKLATVHRSIAASSTLSNPSRAISFNKYSGVCEWENDAFFLWVNLNVPDSDVTNEFLKEGRQMTWFGGSRMHDHSRVIQSLIRVGKRASDNDLPTQDGILLWCRTYDARTRGFGPYVCLGRLGYATHRPGTRPVAFVWNLLDYDALVEREGRAANGDGDDDDGGGGDDAWIRRIFVR